MIATCRNHFQSPEKIAKGHMGRVPLGRVGCKMIAILLRGSQGNDCNGGGVNFLSET